MCQALASQPPSRHYHLRNPSKLQAFRAPSLLSILFHSPIALRRISRRLWPFFLPPFLCCVRPAVVDTLTHFVSSLCIGVGCDSSEPVSSRCVLIVLVFPPLIFPLAFFSLAPRRWSSHSRMSLPLVFFHSMLTSFQPCKIRCDVTRRLRAAHVPVSSIRVVLRGRIRRCYWGAVPGSAQPAAHRLSAPPAVAAGFRRRSPHTWRQACSNAADYLLRRLHPHSSRSLHTT
jgi:hypothetical protein